LKIFEYLHGKLGSFGGLIQSNFSCIQSERGDGLSNIVAPAHLLLGIQSYTPCTLLLLQSKAKKLQSFYSAPKIRLSQQMIAWVED
jgi:hypothetical protein